VVEVDDVEDSLGRLFEAALREEFIQRSLSTNEPGLQAATVSSMRTFVTATSSLPLPAANTSTPTDALPGDKTRQQQRVTVDETQVSGWRRKGGREGKHLLVAAAVSCTGRVALGLSDNVLRATEGWRGEAEDEAKQRAEEGSSEGEGKSAEAGEKKEGDEKVDSIWLLFAVRAVMEEKEQDQEMVDRMLVVGW
jgi:hypothetical protein